MEVCLEAKFKSPKALKIGPGIYCMHENISESYQDGRKCRGKTKGLQSLSRVAEAIERVIFCQQITV